MLSRASSGIAAAILALGVAACGDDEGGGGGKPKAAQENAGVELTIGSKDDTEQLVLAEIYAQALESAGYKVRRETLGSSQAALQAVESGQISGYPEYLSTALGTFFNVAPGDLPHEPTEAAARAQAALRDRGLTGFEPAPYNRTFDVGILVSKADELTVEKLSDLEGKAQDLTLAGPAECAQRADCLGAVEEGYGLEFAEFIPTDVQRRYEVLDDGTADLSILFTPDAKLFVSPSVYTSLDDDGGVFPAGNPFFITSSQAVNEAGPDFQATIERVQGALDLNAIQELNALVLIDGEDPAEVAKGYLEEEGYLRE